MVVGQRIQRCLGLASRRQDSLHGRQGEGPVAHRPLQRRQNVLTGIGGHQREHALGLVLAVPGLGQQALQEAVPDWAKFGEPLPQLFGSTLRIAGRLMVRAATALSSHRSWQERDGAPPRRTPGHG